MKYVLSIILLWAVNAGAEITQTWQFDHADTLKRILSSQGTGHSFSLAISETVKTPDNNKVICLKINTAPPESPDYNKQVIFVYAQGVGIGEKYRLSFDYKGSVSGRININASENTTPYRNLSKSAFRQLNVTPQWQKCILEFEIADNFHSPLAMPRLMIGKFPEKTELYIGPVTLERLNPMLPTALSPQWKIIMGSSSESSIPAAAKIIKLQNGTFSPTPNSGHYDPQNIATFYNEFTSPQEGMMQIGMAADWWFECFINGKPVYNTMKQGNVSAKFIPEDHIFNFPVRQGKNLLCVRVKSGSEGWKFVCDKVAFVADPFAEKLYTPRESQEFHSINPNKYLWIKPGTALDFSGIATTPAPAGSAGRLMVNAKGELVFEKEPAIPVRFLAFNWLLNGWRYGVHKWQKADVERFADNICRRGYNMVRFHFNDTFLMGYRIHQPPHKKLDEITIPQTVEEIDFDHGNLAVFDQLVAVFKKRGIYINLDLMSARTGYTMAYPWGIVKHEKSFKARLFTETTYRNHWRAAVQKLMDHVNPYTGLKLKDEPTIACINFLNEQDLRLADGLHFFTPRFREYLKAKYVSDAALSEAWNRRITFDTIGEIDDTMLRGNDQAAHDAGDFLIGAMSEMSDWFYQTLRAAGYPGLFTHWDMIMRMLEIPARSKMPVIAQHTYFAHPNQLPPANRIKKSRPNIYVNNHASDSMVDQISSINSSYFRAAAAARFLDRPYMITEYSHSSFNKFRHERGLYFGAYAALQGWSALTAHADTVSTTPDPFLNFESGLDPVSVASEAVTAFAFLRGDVTEASHSVGLRLSAQKLFPANYMSSIGDDYAKLAMVTKLGLLYPESKPLTPVGKFTPTLTLEPENFATLSVLQWYVKADNKGNGQSRKLFDLLRRQKIIDRQNPSDPEKLLFQSETGEITLNGQAETMQVTTPRLEGAIIKQNTPVKLGVMTVLSCSRPASIVAVALDKKETLQNAGRILLIVATNAFNTGAIFDSDQTRICYEVGNFPALVQTIQTTVSLKTTRNSQPKVYALNMDGTREQELHAEYQDGILKLSIDTSNFRYGTPYFEITY